MPKAPSLNACWFLLAIGWDESCGHLLEHPGMALLCSLGFLAAWVPAFQEPSPKQEVEVANFLQPGLKTGKVSLFL